MNIVGLLIGLVVVVIIGIISYVMYTQYQQKQAAKKPGVQPSGPGGIFTGLGETAATIVETAGKYAGKGVLALEKVIPKSYDRGVGKLPKCPSGYHSTLGTCLRPAHSYSISGMKAARCPKGYTNMGLTCHRVWPPHTLSGGTDKMECSSDRKKIGGHCHIRCEPGYTNMGKTCYRGPHTISIGNATCLPGWEKQAGLCYKKCKAGYKGLATVCWEKK